MISICETVNNIYCPVIPTDYYWHHTCTCTLGNQAVVSSGSLSSLNKQKEKEISEIRRQVARDEGQEGGYQEHVGVGSL